MLAVVNIATERGFAVNVASWIILAVVIVWIGLAVRSAFFGGSKKSSCHDKEDVRLDAASDADEGFQLPSACSGCSKGNCSGCPSANRDIPTPIIHELK